MERKQERRLYYSPQTSGLSKYVIGNGARCASTAVDYYGALRRKEDPPSNRTAWAVSSATPSSNMVFPLFILLHSTNADPELLLLSFRKGRENHSWNPPVSQCIPNTLAPCQSTLATCVGTAHFSLAWGSIMILVSKLWVSQSRSYVWSLLNKSRILQQIHMNIYIYTLKSPSSAAENRLDITFISKAKEQILGQMQTPPPRMCVYLALCFEMFPVLLIMIL